MDEDERGSGAVVNADTMLCASCYESGSVPIRTEENENVKCSGDRKRRLDFL